MKSSKHSTVGISLIFSRQNFRSKQTSYLLWMCVCVVPWSVDFPTTMKTGGKKSGSHSSSRGSSSLQCRQVAELFPSSSGRRKTKTENRGPFWSKSWPISSFFFGVVPLLAGHMLLHTHKKSAVSAIHRLEEHSSDAAVATPMATDTKVFSMGRYSGTLYMPQSQVERPTSNSSVIFFTCFGPNSIFFGKSANGVGL